MKKRIFLFSLLGMVIFVSCTGNEHNKADEVVNSDELEQYTPQAAGAVVAESSMPVTDDPLNHFDFTIKIKTNEYSNRGTYTIDAAYGPNTANSMFTMPRGGSHLKPILRKGKEPYTYIIGFEYRKQFYEYYLVRGGKSSIEVKNIQAYSFQ